MRVSVSVWVLYMFDVCVCACVCVLCDWGRNMREGDGERKVRIEGLGGLLSATQCPYKPSLEAPPHSNHACAHEL